jgi:hypothetical protein
VTQVSKRQAQVVAKEIAKALGEKQRKPVGQIAEIVQFCGVGFTQAILKETLDIEASGGMKTINGERRRTPGGVFFYLARGKMEEDIRNQIFPNWYTALQNVRTREAQFPEFMWNDRREILDNALAARGEATDVKVTITGRPGEIERRQYLVVTAMESMIPDDTVFPKGVPQPPMEPVTYVTYISSKQWEKVAEAIENPHDQLIVEGMCAYDPETDGMAVFATHVTTSRLQTKVKKEARRDDAGKREKTRPNGAVKPEKRKNGRSFDMPSAPPEFDVDIPKGMTAEDAEKLMKLEKAAASFRQKINEIESKPPGQRVGLEMRQNLLKKTEQDIDTLRSQYDG